jgi:hypothetical protein
MFFVEQFIPIENMFEYLQLSEMYSTLFKAHGFANYFKVLSKNDSVFGLYDVECLVSNGIFMSLDHNHFMATHSIGYEHD